jgi:hypothetical protein
MAALTQEQVTNCRNLYFLDLPLDEVSDGYRKVIRALLDTISDRDMEIDFLNDQLAKEAASFDFGA